MPQLALQVLFWSSLGALLHTYLLYPAWVWWLARGRNRPAPAKAAGTALPYVSVIVCVYNEEQVIGSKMESLLKLDHPLDRLRIIVGSDASTDRSNEILRSYSDRWPHIDFHPFPRRRGKPGLLNHLVRLAFARRPASPDHLLLFTDANVMVSPGLLRHLVPHFGSPQRAIVDARMVSTGTRRPGISRPEKVYLSNEVMLKYREGMLWGGMVGPFGGCYALRSTFFREVPPAFLVDDFYIAMKAFEQGGTARSDLEAVCYEAASHDWREEYRRKARISAGNFQNLAAFSHLWWPPRRPLGFAIFSHKVLRWLGPFFLLNLLLSSGLLALAGRPPYPLLFGALNLALFLLPLTDLALNQLRLHWLPLRGLRHFTLMNVALLHGFILFAKGVKNNVWEPPKRHGGGHGA